LLSEDAAARFDDARDAVSRRLQLQRHRASSDARVLQLSVARVWAETERVLASRPRQDGAPD
jgi:hypothetical protein